MSHQHFDLIVIGTGPSAGTVARKTAEDGKTVAVIESRQFGGVCALRGCNPKKVYTNAGDLIDRVRRASGKLLNSVNPQIDWSQLLQFKREFTQPVVENSEASFLKQGITTVHGTARFIGPRQIDVNGETFEAKRIFVGTGSTPVKLGIDGEEHLTHSDEFMELSSIPDHVTFVGGGYISMEFAHVVARFGSKVVVVDHNDRPLQHFDPDLVEQLVGWSEQTGIEFIRNASVESVSVSADRYRVAYDRDGKHEEIATDLVVHGAGRMPSLADLNLPAGSVEFSDAGIAVDKFMRSVSNSNVFASGDCAATDCPRLTPVANEQARIVVKNLFADSVTHQPDYGAVPSVVFTSPCLAAVGLSEAEANVEIDNLVVRHEDTSQWGSPRKHAQPCAAYKILIDNDNDRIVGAHLLGPGAEETINLFALAMKFGLTATDLKSTLFAFPTFSADVRNMV